MDSQQVRELFDQAVDLSAAEREIFLQHHCQGNPDLRQQVDSLLAALDSPLNLLQRLDNESRAGKAHWDSDQSPPFPIIDRYELIRLLGEGGMGTVWEALQSQPLRRRVALKLVKPGLDHSAVLRRFEAERQTLSIMDHPGIARVFDAGTAPDGRPWFVMELVQGEPITDWCDRNHVSADQRLELFIQVCDAVQHAHQKGVIHRDLKPSNILVTNGDGHPAIKIIDFGISKALGPPLDLESPFTQSGQIMGTLEYMSPEQAAFNQTDIDTRSDIYSLGVLLFEMLTGSTPFNRSQLQDAALDEMLRIIREEEPQRPSDRLSKSPTNSSIAAKRDTAPLTLTRKMRGELDWIALRALEKNRERRYVSAAELAADVRRYLEHEPVLAGPPSPWYRFRKFVQKHRWAVATVAIGIGLLLAGVIGTSTGLFRSRLALARERQALLEKSQALLEAQQARLLAEAANQKTVEALNSLTGTFVERWMMRQDELAPADRAFLQDVLTSYEEVAAGQSQAEQATPIRVRGLHQVADLRSALGDYALADPLYRQARDGYQQLTAAFPDRLDYLEAQARCLLAHGRLEVRRRNIQESESLFQQAIEQLLRLTHFAEPPPSCGVLLVEAYGEYASSLHRQGKTEPAIQAFESAESAFQEIPEKNMRSFKRKSLLAALLHARCHFYRDLGKFEAALADGERVLQLLSECQEMGIDLAQFRLESSSIHRILGTIHQAHGNFAPAEHHLRSALVAAQSLVIHYPLAPKHRTAVCLAHRTLGNCFLAQRNFSQAIDAFQQSVNVSQRLWEDFPDEPGMQYEHAESLGTLGLAYKDSGQLPLAERNLHASVELKRKVAARAPDTLLYRQSLAAGLHNLANVLAKQKNPAQAEPAYREALALRATLVEHHPELPALRMDLGGSYCDLGKMLVDTGRTEEGLEPLSEAVEILEDLAKTQNELVNIRLFLRNACQNRGVAYQQLKRWPEAFQDFSRALEMDDGANRTRLRQHQLICQAHFDLDGGIAAAEGVLDSPDSGAGDRFTAARVLAYASGTHPDEAQRKQSAQRAVSILLALHESGTFRDPVIAATLQQHAEFEPLRTHPEFAKLLEATDGKNPSPR